MNHNLPIGARLRSPKSNFEYEIVDTLGSGGFGITYLATTTMLMGNIPVTVKVAIKEHFLSGARPIPIICRTPSPRPSALSAPARASSRRPAV